MRRALFNWGVGTTLLACLALLMAPNAHAVTLITNGSSQIGSFPVAESEMPDTAWRIDTSSLDSATVVTTTSDFEGPSNTTLSNPTGWTRLVNESYDDSYVEVPFGFSVNFNTVSYTGTFVGSNTYVTFGNGADDYSGLAADVPPYPADHICSNDHSYQRVYYKLDDANTMRVRYEGTDSTGGTVGSPTIVIEYLFHSGQSYHDVFIGRHDGCGPEQAPYVDKLGTGDNGDYSLSATAPGSPENDRGDLYAGQLVFTLELNTSSRATVEGTISAMASGDSPRYAWSGSTLNIYSSSTVTFPNDAYAEVTSLTGYTANRLLLIDADDVAPTVTPLGDGTVDYELPSTCPSVACDRGDIYGAVLTFSEDLDAGSQAAVEAAITAGASVAPRTYAWHNNVVRIYATEPVTFAEDVYADLTDALGNTGPHQKLIDSLPVPPSEVWVDDSYNPSSSGGHEWGYDAFDYIGDGLNAVTEGGTVHVLAGDYEDNSYTIDKNGISLVGPASGGQAVLVTSCDSTITINGGASGVTLSHLKILQTDGGYIGDSYCYSTPVIRVGWDSASTTIANSEIAGGRIGVALRYDAANNTLRNNNIHDNDWAGVVDLSNGVDTFKNNTITDNGYGLSFGRGPDGTYPNALGGTVVSGNTITGNTDAGIYFASGDQGSAFNIGPSNDIHDNSDGIYIDGNAYNVHINGNKIYDNIMITSGLHVVDASTGLDATENWWGDASGPYEELYNASGTGDQVYITGSSQFVNYRPFCTNDTCGTLSVVAVDPSNIAALFQNGGSITPILTSPDDADPATVLVDSLQVNEDVTITIPGSGGTSVTLPAGTVITKTDGGTFDANDMTASQVALNALSGFGANTVVEGALQWGVPNLGLTFSQPITIHIFVGTDLNGRTLTVARSTGMSSGWTTDGIVAPASCLVASGICSFQTTKASYYASKSYSGASSGGGGGSGSMAPVTSVYQSMSNDPNREANLANLTKINVSIDTLVKMANDGNPATQEDSAVYYIGGDGKRHAFPSSRIYLTWYADFSGVKTIEADKLASIPLGSNVRYKPGVRMVKFQTVSKVYVVSAGGLLRWIPTESMAKSLYGDDWNTKIDDLSDTMFNDYKFGTDVSVAEPFVPATQIANISTINKDFGF